MDFIENSEQYIDLKNYGWKNTLLFFLRQIVTV